MMTTPGIGAAIQANPALAWQIAERYGISGQTGWKWRKRASGEDHSQTPHRLPGAGALTPVCGVAPRSPVSLNDLRAVVQELPNPEVSRAGLDLRAKPLPALSWHGKSAAT
ncbi:MAG: hypothetical protein GDA36_02555 [Rhodobacteraceae bacterium]|nr:hypothetical protein [Paracoccaceae bacterium]